MSDKTVDKNEILEKMSIEHRKPFSLIELLMIIMIVGTCLTIFIPVQQARQDELKVKDTIKVMQQIVQAEIDYKNNPALGNGSFAIDISELKSATAQLDTTYFNYAVSDTAVVATSTKNFSKPNVVFYYHLTEQRYMVNKEFKDVIDINWLP